MLLCFLESSWTLTCGFRQAAEVTSAIVLPRPFLSSTHLFKIRMFRFPSVSKPRFRKKGFGINCVFGCRPVKSNVSAVFEASFAPRCSSFLAIHLLSRTFRTTNGLHPVDLPRLQESAIRVPVPHPFSNVSDQTLSLINQDQKNEPDQTSFNSGTPESHHIVSTKAPPALLPFTRCGRTPNRFTNHIRLPSPLYNISMVPKHATYEDTRKFWNPTVIALPSWAGNQYLILSMILLKDQGYKQTVFCEANICYPKSQYNLNERKLSKICSEDDFTFLGPNGGLRCVHQPVEVKIPPTHAQKCEGLEKGLADIPGFHDPRAFYSGRGEPILMVVSQ